jgi:DNA-binding NarL/FixJ family response regulator
MIWLPDPAPRLLLADDHPIFLAGLQASLVPEFRVAATVAHLDQLEPAIRRADPDIALVDLAFSGESALRLLRQCGASPDRSPRFAILTAHSSSALQEAAFRAGACGYFVKGSGIQEIKAGLRIILQGQRVSLRDAAMKPLRTGVRTVGGFRLSDLQAQLLPLLRDGCSRPRMARCLGLPESEVDQALDSLQEALGFDSMRTITKWYDGPDLV